MSDTLFETSFHLPGQTDLYRGKVRDVYSIGPNRLVIVASDRISAFDVILPRPIPYKGQVLTGIARHVLDATRDIVPNWLESVPHPNVMVGRRAEPIRIEMVIRGFLVGHAWRVYRDGGRTLCGVPLPDGLRENDPLPHPIITPATKAEEGHDEDISEDEILHRGLVTEAEWQTLKQHTRALFQRGSDMAAERGLILVDTKYEFGRTTEGIILIDEIHTPDSSRYFVADGFEERLDKGEKQRHLSKEFVREWLMENGFQGQDGQTVPEMTDHVVQMISHRYIELFERMTGARFSPTDDLDGVEQAIRSALCT